MDQKTWLWRKKPSEKTIVANGKDGPQLKGILEEGQSLPNEKEVALEKSVNILKEKLTSLISEYNAKEELLANHTKMAQEAVAGRERAETELLHLRKDLDEALQHKFAANERLGNLNAALKDCMQQLSSTREEQEQRVHDAIMRTTEGFEKAHKKLEEKLSETSKKLANLRVENSHLGKVLLLKENLIEDLSNRRAQVEAEFDALMSRLDSVEKENAFLLYELRMLQKDLDNRNEEIEFSRHSLDASEKQLLESVKKIKKLEGECQRLRVLVRKRLPGPAALANMKTEVEIQGRYQLEGRRRKLNPHTGGLVVREQTRENLDISNKRISFLVERLQNVEQENKILRDMCAKEDNDISFTKIAGTPIISISSDGEAQSGRHHKAQVPMELAVSNTLSNELSSIPGFSNCEEHDSNSSRSWASALISELENFKDGDLKNTSENHMIGISDMSLMDDFVEMEKLAIVAVDVPDGSHIVPDSLKKDMSLNHVDSTGRELVPLGNDDLSDINQEMQTSNSSLTKHCNWLQAVVKLIVEQVKVSERSADELLEAIKIALHSETYQTMSSPQCTPGPSELLPISGYITWKSPATSPSVCSFERVPEMSSLVEDKSHEHIQSINSSICNIVELVRKFDFTSSDDCTAPNNMSKRAAEEYVLHVFGWKNCELTTILQKFVDTCDNLLSGKVDFQKFAAELSSALGWILKNCIINHETSTAKYEYKHLSGLNGSGVANESVQNLLLEMEKIHCLLEAENKVLKTELNSLKPLQKDLEPSLQLAGDKSEALACEVQNSQQNIRRLQTELEMLRESKRIIEDQFENQKLINEDLDTQLTVTKVRLNDVSQKLSSLQVELEDKSHCCEELDGTCLELQLQLESITNKEMLKDNVNQEEKLLQTGWEINAASAKLAECEATILNLGNQLKTLASPKEAPCAKNGSYTPRKNYKMFNRRFSLLDRMISEDNVDVEDLKYSKKKKIMNSTDTQRQQILQINSQRATYSSSDQLEEPPAVYLRPEQEKAKPAIAGPLVLIPSKKRGGIGFLRKLLLRRKRRSSNKTSFSFAM